MVKVGNRRGTGWLRGCLDVFRHVAVQVTVSVIVAALLKGASLAGLGQTVFAGIPWLGDAREEAPAAPIQASVPASGRPLPILAVIGMPPVLGTEPGPAPAPSPVTLVLPEPEVPDTQASPHRPRPLAAPRVVVERPCGACQPEETAPQPEPVLAPEPRDLPPLPPGYVGTASAAADDRADGITGSIQATLASAGNLVAQTIGRGQHALPMLAGHFH